MLCLHPRIHTMQSLLQIICDISPLGLLTLLTIDMLLQTLVILLINQQLRMDWQGLRAFTSKNHFVFLHLVRGLTYRICSICSIFQEEGESRDGEGYCRAKELSASSRATTISPTEPSPSGNLFLIPVLGDSASCRDGGTAISLILMDL